MAKAGTLEFHVGGRNPGEQVQVLLPGIWVVLTSVLTTRQTPAPVQYFGHRTILVDIFK